MGGMAEVYLAKNPGIGIAKFVAMKRILPQFSENPDFIEMFKAEAKIAVNLSHGNIVSIHEFGTERNQFFLVMEYVEGRNLRQILNKMKKGGQNFPIEQVLYIIKEVAAGLDHAHRCIDGTTGRPLNIIHRDMSPQNVMVSFEGEVKVVDFGIAKAETQIESTRAGTLKGKFGYMSPEQAEGLQVDLRTDVFSLGIVLWELLANDRLFMANNEINTLRKIRDCQIPSLRKMNPSIHPDLEKICETVLAKDRNQRYQTAAAFHKDLNRFLNRHYPDFSPHDFSLSIKNLFAAEILETRKKLIEYAKVVAQPAPAPAKPAAAEPTQVTVTETLTEDEINPNFGNENYQIVEKLRATVTKKNPLPSENLQLSNDAAKSLDGLQFSKLQIDPASQVKRPRSQTSVTNPSLRAKPPRFNYSAIASTFLIVMICFSTTGAGIYYWMYPEQTRAAVRQVMYTLRLAEPREVVSVPVVQEMASKSARISISSSPSNANIYIDDKPLRETTPTVYEIPNLRGKKTVKVRLKLDGYREFVQTLDLDGSETQMPVVNANLTRDRVATLDVYVKGEGEIFVNGQKVAQRSPASGILVPADQDIEVKVVDPNTNAVDSQIVRIPEGKFRSINLYPRRKSQ